MKTVKFPPSALKFAPDMTLMAAARIAHENGCELHVQWNGKLPVVVAIKKLSADQQMPAFLKTQAGEH
jgi:hypothetical protein